MKNMPKWLVISGYAAGLVLVVISSILTAILFESMAQGSWMGKMFAVGGISVDIGKIVTATAFVYLLKKKQYLSSLLPALLYILCFIVSMVASQSLDLNKANEIRNDTITASDEYTFSKSTVDSSESDIQRYLTDIKSLESSEQARTEQAIEHLQAEKQAAQAKNWLTTPKGSPRRGVDVIKSDIAKVKQNVREQLQFEVQSLKDDIKSSRKSQNNAKGTISNLQNGGGTLTTSGLIAFAEWVNPENPTKVLGNFYLFKNIFCEILGTYLLVFMNPKSAQAGKQSSIQPSKQETKQAPPKQIPSKQSVKPAIGFHLEKKASPGLNEQEKVYLKIYEERKQSNQAKGYKAISKVMQLPENQCREIRLSLVSKKLIG